MPEVTLAQVLQSREDRVQKQEQLRRRYGSTILCFTMNIAGPVKISPLIERGFRAGLAMLEQRLSPSAILHREVLTAVTGCQALYAVSIGAPEAKEICVAIEDSLPLGRLFDMDVLAADGSKLTRGSLRGCLVCGAPGRGCAARRLHSVGQLQAATKQLLTEHFSAADRVHIAALAVQGLLDEVQATPKPGLVDRRNNGSHTDMDLHTFTVSAHALEPYFAQCVGIGQRAAEDSPQHTFSLLRQAGIAAERTMYQATGGVNTHKGAIYSMGLLCGSLGRLWNPEGSPPALSAVLAQCSAMAAAAAKEDFASMDGSTAGQRLYLQRGITGIRGEAAAGFPSVLQTGLPAFRAGLARGLRREDAGVLSLLHLIPKVEDTNLYHRGGEAGAVWAKETVSQLLKDFPYPAASQLEELDDAFIARKLSPGGCADLLALTFFLDRLNDTGFLDWSR